VAGVAYLVYEAWTKNWGGIRDKVQEMVGKIKQIITNLKNMSWQEIGLAILRGVAKGITNGLRFIKNAAVNAARSAFNAAKGFLGIHSPSQLFAGIGENMMLGMAGGIGDFASVPIGVTQEVSSNIAAAPANTGNTDIAGAINNMSSGQGIDYVKLTRMLRDAVLQGQD